MQEGWGARNPTAFSQGLIDPFSNFLFFFFFFTFLKGWSMFDQLKADFGPKPNLSFNN